MQRRLDLPLLLLLAAGAALAGARPRWGGTLDDRVVAACWVAAVVLWAWLVSVGAIHAWATRTGRVRWRHLTGALLPASIRRRVEQLAMAGLLVVPVAACADGGGATSAPVLVLEEAVPLDPAATWAPRPPGAAEDASTTAFDAPAPEPSTTVAPPTGGGTATPIPSPELDDTSTTTGAAAVDTTPVAPGGTAPPPAEVAPDPSAAGAGAVDPDGPDPVDDPAFVVPVEPGTRVVLRGDHLWSIAVEEVAAATGRSPDGDEVRRYWAALLEANQATLASGDPDVIYPGEVLRLPAHQP